MKVCIKCGIDLCGLQLKYCSICASLVKKENSKLNHARWLLTHKTYAQQYHARWRRTNIKHMREWKRTWETNNLEKVVLWRKNNPLKISEYQRRRRATKNNVVELFTEEQWMAKKEATKGICPKCNEYVGFERYKGITMHHSPPLSKAPPKQIYTIDDVSPLCWSCNAKQHNFVEKQ